MAKVSHLQDESTSLDPSTVYKRDGLRKKTQKKKDLRVVSLELITSPSPKNKGNLNPFSSNAQKTEETRGTFTAKHPQRLTLFFANPMACLIVWQNQDGRPFMQQQ